MRIRTAILAAAFTVALPAPALAADVVISEVYGGGGNSGAALKSDFVELLNTSSTAVPLSGWKVEYASATGTFSAPTLLSGSIAPGGRYLVKQADGANAAAAPLPTPDATGSITMSASAGKVRLTGGSGPVDLVGYGATANAFEGSGPAPTLSNTTAAARKAGGCLDSDDNRADFVAGAPTPQNSSAAPTSCSAPTGTGSASPAAVPAGGETTLRVTTAAAGARVAVDATPVGGPAGLTLTDPDGDGTFTAPVTVAPSTPPGTRRLVATITDARGLSGTTTIEVTVLEPCGAPTTAISAVQGDGATSPRLGDAVAVEGVVVGDYQQAGGFGGFYIQSLLSDDDAATSEGLFVSSSAPVNAGDVVRARGVVSELTSSSSGVTSSLTRLTGVQQATVCATGQSAEPAALRLPAARLSDLERYEGMLVRSAQALTVTETFTLGRFGELRLAAGGRLYAPTNVVAPGAAARALADANRRRSFVLDDGDTTQNRDPVRYPMGGLSATNTLRSGSTVPELTAVFDERFGTYRAQPVGDVAFTATNPRPQAPQPVGGTLQVAAFNVLNFFNGPSFPTARGASSPQELERQTAKEVAALAGLDADVVGLMELENDGGEGQAVEELVAAVNARVGAGTYAYVDTGVVGTDAIRVGLLYKPAVVRPLGRPAILTSAVDARFVDTLNRPTIAQAFESRSSLEVVTVAVNHLKSKGSSCAAVGDPDTGDGQGNCNVTRTNAARALADWLAGDPTDSGSPDAFVVGDLNSYAEEDPIGVLRAAGFADQIRRFGGAGAYSYVFNGEAGYLDHALASESLSPKVTGATDWHINADEPTALDYNMEFKSDAQDALFYAPDPYRSSDHDPLLAGLDLDPTYAGQLQAVRRYVTDPDVRAGLIDKLEAARRAEALGKTKTEANVLRAYRNQLRAQTGKAVPAELAATLQDNSTKL